MPTEQKKLAIFPVICSTPSESPVTIHQDLNNRSKVFYWDTLQSFLPSFNLQFYNNCLMLSWN